jgi:hypothetical protein
LKKNGGPAAQALGRSRDGWSTKIHAGCIEEKTGVSLALTGGACHDAPGCDPVFEQLPPENSLAYGVMDKAYDSHHLREKLSENALTPVIPPKSKRKEAIDYDKDQ